MYTYTCVVCCVFMYMYTCMCTHTLTHTHTHTCTHALRLASSIQVLQPVGGSAGSSTVCGHHVCHPLVLCRHHHRGGGCPVHVGQHPQARYMYMYMYIVHVHGLKQCRIGQGLIIDHYSRLLKEINIQFK